MEIHRNMKIYNVFLYLTRPRAPQKYNVQQKSRTPAKSDTFGKRHESTVVGALFTVEQTGHKIHICCLIKMISLSKNE